MTQPAKSQEPSMEEILASIRRIIADDDATKSVQRTPEPPKPAAVPPVRPPSAVPRAAAPAPILVEVEPEPDPQPAAGDSAPRVAAEDPSADILDLTESMAAPPSPPSSAAMVKPMPQFRTIDGYSAAEIAFDNVRVLGQDRIGGGRSIEADLERVIDEATVALCAEAAGSIEAILSMTVDYAKTRKQRRR